MTMQPRAIFDRIAPSWGGWFARQVSRWLILAGLAFPAFLQAQVTNTLVSEGFEGAFPGTTWTVGDSNLSGGSVYWDDVNTAFGTVGVHSGSWKGYCAAIGFGGTTANPTYQTNMGAYMSRPINLTGFGFAQLSFWHVIPSIEANYDNARVYIDTNLIWAISNSVAAWTQVVLSLDDYVGGTHTLKFEFDSDVSIVHEGWYLDDIAVIAVPPPANDAFVNAYAISGSAGSTNGNSFAATKEVGEPSYTYNSGGASVWYRWVAPSSGTVTFNTYGSSFDTVLAVYTGSSVGALTKVVEGDDTPIGNSSSLTFNATVGQAYNIAIDGYDGLSGHYVLNWMYPTVTETVLSTTVTNYSLFVIDSDASNGGAGYDRDTLRINSSVASTNRTSTAHYTTYVLSYRLLDTNNQPFPIFDVTGATNASYTYNVTNTLFIGSSQNSTSTTFASLRPAARLNPYNLYTSELKIYRLGAYTGASASFGPGFYLQFTNMISGDPMLNVIPFQAPPNWNQTYAISNAPGKNAFQVSVVDYLFRYDDYTAGAPNTSNVTVYYTYELHNGANGALVPLKQGSSNVVHALDSYAAGSPNTPAGILFYDVLQLEPAGQLDSVSNRYYAVIHMSCDNGPGKPVVVAQTVQTTTNQLLHFNSHLTFGGIDTKFTSINNVPTAGLIGNGYVNTSLSVDANSGYVTAAPDHTYGSGAPLSVRLWTNGVAELIGGAVTLIPPSSPDWGVVANVRFQRGTITLDTSGGHGNITVVLPSGFGYRTSDISSKTIYSQILFPTVALTQSLGPLPSTLTYNPGVTIFSCEESKPLWIQSSIITWRTTVGHFDVPPTSTLGGEAQYVRHAEYAYLTSVSNSLADPPGMAWRRSNERFFDYANGIADSVLDLAADSRSNAVLSATFLFGGGGFRSHFPYDSKFEWSVGGSMKVVQDVVAGGAASTLSVAQPVTVPYSRGCPGCSGGLTNEVSVDLVPDGGLLYFSADGGLLASGATVGTITLQWGYAPTPGAYAQQSSNHIAAAVHMPGSFLPGNVNLANADHAPATILFTGINATNLTQIERPLASSYDDGYADYAGLNFRCGSDGAHWANSMIGGRTNISWPLTGRSKYYVRYSGVSGIHEALTFPSTNLYIYGYKFHFSNYGLSYLDSQVDESRTYGDVTIPPPSMHVQNFDELMFNCLGALTTAKVPSNDGGHKLDYWQADFFTLAINFVRNDTCIPGQGWLTLGVKAFATHVDQPLYGVLGFLTNGNLIARSDGVNGVTSRLKGPNVINVAGPSGTTYNFNPVSDFYYNSHVGTPPTVGFMNVAGKLNVPFFEDLKIHLHTLCASNSPTNLHSAIHLSGGWPRVGTTNYNHGWSDGMSNSFFTTNFFDWSNLGYPVGIVSAENYEDNSVEAYHPRAQRLWLGMIEFDYPLTWDKTLHTFKSFQEVRNDLFVINVQHQVKYMNPKEAEIDFGAQYDGLPKISVANIAFNAIDEATGVSHAIITAAEQPIEQALTSGLDEFDQVLDTQLKRLFDGVFDKAVDPIIHSFYVQLASDWALLPQSQKTNFLNSVSNEVANFFAGSGGVGSNLNSVLQALGDGSTPVNNLIGQLDTYLRDIITAIDAVNGTVTNVNGVDIGSLPGLITPNESGQRDVAMKLVKSLVGDIASQFLSATVGPQLSNLLQQAEAPLSEISTALTDARNVLSDVRAKLAPAKELSQEINHVFTSASAQLQSVSVQVSHDVSNLFGKLDFTVDNPFQEFTEAQIRNYIRQQVEDEFFGSAPAAAVQVVLKQRLYDLDAQMKTGIDSVFQQLNQTMRDLISQSLAGLDDSINGLLGDVSSSMGAGKINGHAIIDGDSLKLLRLDGHFEWKAAGTMEFDAYLQIKELNSDGTSGCYSSNSPATEVTIGAKKVDFGWISDGLKANVETKFTFDNSGSFPVNFAGSVELLGELDYEAFKLHDLAAALAFGKYENYLALRGGIKFDGYDFSGGIYFGRTCSLDPIKLIDPDVADMLGAPPFTGIYCYGQGWIPVSEAVLGIPASCLFEISAGVGAGAFYFEEGPTYGGKMFLGVSGEALCIVSIEGDITLIGVKHGDDLSFKGIGHFEADIGPCPFCISFSKTVTLQYKNHSWHLD